MAYTFQGIDPSTTGRTGLQAQQYLQGVLGRPLSTAQIGQASQFLGGIGYGDTTGASAMTGGQWNQLMEEAARLTPGSTFNAYQAPASPTPPAPIALENPAAPEYQAPEYQAPEAFEYEPWRATTAADLDVDPSYRNRLIEGQKSLERSRAAQGTLRTGGTMQALVDYGQRTAAEEFGNVDARRRADYATGYGTAADIYGINTGEGRYGHEQRTGAAEAEYAPSLLSWQTQREDANRARELNFDRDWQRELYEGDDAFRRQEAERAEAYRNRTYDTDDAFRRWLAELQNRQFLAEIGTRQ